MEKVDANTTQSLESANQLLAEVRRKENDVKEIEERYSSMQGLEKPTTLDARLTTLRGKWKEVRVLHANSELTSFVCKYVNILMVLSQRK